MGYAKRACRSNRGDEFDDAVSSHRPIDLAGPAELNEDGFGSKIHRHGGSLGASAIPWQLTKCAAPRTIEECRLSLAGRRDNPNRS
jgi:hypothetical protein